MSLPLRISAEAEDELEAAARWYEQSKVGLGREFLAAVDETMARIVENPRAGSPVPAVDDKDIRRFFVQRCPYHVVYTLLTNRLQVLAIAHDRRRPGYWVDRLPK